MRSFISSKLQLIFWTALLIGLPFTTLRAQTFLQVPLNLSLTGHAAVPSIAVGAAGEINVVWLDSGAILFRRSTDGGQTFSAPITVATSNLPSQSLEPQVATNSAGVYVAWAGTNNTGGGDIFFSSSSNGVNSWTAPVNVSQGRGIASGNSAPVPRIAVDPGGGVDVVWGQNGAYFARTTDHGTSFMVATLSTSAMASVSPRMAINSAGHVFVVWESAGSCPSIMFARSTDRGANFAPYSVADDLTVNTQHVTGCTSDVQIAVGANNTIWLLWANENPNIQDLIITYATDQDPFTQNGSTSFPESIFENLSPTASHSPRMAIESNGSVDVAWIGDTSQSDSRQTIYFSRSTDPQRGGTFCGGPNNTICPNLPVLSSAQNLPSGSPQIAVEPSGAVDVIWQQGNAANPNAYDIVLGRSTDGVNFTRSVLSNAPTTQSGTSIIAADASGNAYAAWQQSSGSSGDVFLNGDSAGLKLGAQFGLSAVKSSITPLSATITAGGSASFNLLLTSTNSVPGSVTLGCSGAPAGVNCSFNPNLLTLAPNGSTSVTLNVVVTVKPSASTTGEPAGRIGMRPSLPAPVVWGWYFGLAVAIAAVAAFRRWEHGQFARVLLIFIAIIAIGSGLVSCGGSTQNNGGGGGSVTFPLTVRAQSNSATADLQTISITVP